MLHKNNQWKIFIKTLGDNPLNTKPIWNKINEMRGKTSKSSIPTFIENDIKYETDEAKANLFANKLKQIFSDPMDSRFDEKFKQEVHSFLLKHNLNKAPFTTKDSFSEVEFNDALKNLKKHGAAGKDDIHNLLLINASVEFKAIILKLFNLTTKLGSLPSSWKESVIKMIPKKKSNISNINDYRPISLTSCLSKLCEKMVKNQLNEFLKKNNLIIKQQSGFRAHRQTKDNIFHISQNILQSFQYQ